LSFSVLFFGYFYILNAQNCGLFTFSKKKTKKRKKERKEKKEGKEKRYYKALCDKADLS